MAHKESWQVEKTEGTLPVHCKVTRLGADAVYGHCTKRREQHKGPGDRSVLLNQMPSMFHEEEQFSMVFPGSFRYDENSHSCFSKQENTMACLCALSLTPESAEQPLASSACHEAPQSYHCCEYLGSVCLCLSGCMFCVSPIKMHTPCPQSQ